MLEASRRQEVEYENFKILKYRVIGMKKRLHKSATDSKIFGVCGGLGEYFGIDSTILRVLFLGSTLFFGVGPLTYLVCAICFPNEDSI